MILIPIDASLQHELNAYISVDIVCVEKDLDATLVTENNKVYI